MLVTRAFGPKRGGGLVGRQAAGSAAPRPRRDVGTARWKLAASWARVADVGHGDWACTCPLYRAVTLDKFKDVALWLEPAIFGAHWHLSHNGNVGPLSVGSEAAQRSRSL